MHHYRIIKESIGEGTFGTVAKAKHLPSNSIRALKQIHIKRQEFTNGNIPKQTLREMRALQQVLGHDNIIQLLDAFAEGNSLVLAMEFVERDLAWILSEARHVERVSKCALLRMANHEKAKQHTTHVDRDASKSETARQPDERNRSPQSREGLIDGKNAQVLHLGGLNHRHQQPHLAPSFQSSKNALSESAIKCILLQTLRGVAWCHRRGIMHRDLKPANLLLTNDGTLKIADFGLATIYLGAQGHKYSHQVATRWYRAPELLYGSVTYDFAVDIYAVGCIFSEIINNCPLFPGNNDIDQLTRVLTAFGNPDESSWPGISKLPDYNKISFPKCEVTPLEELIPNASPDALDLLRGMLHYDPQKRITAEEALKHPYFFKEPIPCHESELASEVSTLLAGCDSKDMNDNAQNSGGNAQKREIDLDAPFEFPHILGV
eukprot:CAMPEP_0117450422 /NCGR_PEP_ID=MMETSP0759-20121206/8460_1 /TAXON_ID=63605 /ORGANISM="Percolomonas cosmopolitus, Strain WS" /LENGTH=433 /DNA_ID=CAMNT_0005242943 /DNA_START=48 /DNA_END=1349 /DNA_ORIENTATION=+